MRVVRLAAQALSVVFLVVAFQALARTRPPPDAGRIDHTGGGFSSVTLAPATDRPPAHSTLTSLTLTAGKITISRQRMGASTTGQTDAPAHDPVPEGLTTSGRTFVVSATVSRSSLGPRLSVIFVAHQWISQLQNDEATGYVVATIKGLPRGAVTLCLSASSSDFKYRFAEAPHGGSRPYPLHDGFYVVDFYLHSEVNFQDLEDAAVAGSLSCELEFNLSNVVAIEFKTPELTTYAPLSAYNVSISYPAITVDLAWPLKYGIPDTPATLSICYGQLYDIADLKYVAEFVVEMIEYHARIGVTRFVFYVSLELDDDDKAILNGIIELYKSSSIEVHFVNSSAADNLKSWYRGQVLFINDCIKKVSAPNSYVFSVDIDEWLLFKEKPLSDPSMTIPRLIADLKAVESARPEVCIFNLGVTLDHVLFPDVCSKPDGSDATLEAVTKSLRQGTLKFPQYDTYVTGLTFPTGARRKPLANTDVILSSSVHHMIPNRPCLKEQPYPFSDVSPFVKLHMRSVHLSPVPCREWQHEWVIPDEGAQVNMASYLNWYKNTMSSIVPAQLQRLQEHVSAALHVKE